MKYMTFRSSCSFAGVANMLSRFGVEVQDRDIALGMGLPYLFAHEDGCYLTGPMLQSAVWFNLYLHPIGFHLEEAQVPRSQVCGCLRQQACAMLGLRTGSGKHAVVYLGMQGDALHFLNNKWQHSDEPETLLLTEAELSAHLDDQVMIATLYPIPPESADLSPLRRESCTVLRANLAEISRLCGSRETVAALRDKMDPLFRAMLLDGITMLGLIGESELARQFTMVQTCLLAALRQEPSTTLCLGDFLPLAQLEDAVSAYIRLIENA